jgi:hypothetical protein
VSYADLSPWLEQAGDLTPAPRWVAAVERVSRLGEK